MTVKIKGKNGVVTIGGDVTGQVHFGSLETTGELVFNEDGFFVDGVRQEGIVSISAGAMVTLNVQGECLSVTTMSADVHVSGGVGTVETVSGDVTCGDVTGSVKTMSGDVTCGLVQGGVKTMSGNIRPR